MSITFIKKSYLCWVLVFLNFSSNLLYSQTVERRHPSFVGDSYKSDLIHKILDGRRGQELFQKIPSGWQWHEWRELAQQLGKNIWVLVKNDEVVAKNLSGVDQFKKYFRLEYQILLQDHFDLVELLLIEKFYSDQHQDLFRKIYRFQDQCVLEKERSLTLRLMHDLTHRIRKQRPLDLLIQNIMDGKESPVSSQKISTCTSCTIS